MEDQRSETTVDEDCPDIEELSAPPVSVPWGPPWADDGFDVSEILTDMSQSHHSPTLYRDAVISQIMAVLISRDKPNALLVGPAGSGKTNIVEELAARVSKGGRNIPKRLRKCKIYSISMSEIVSGSGLVGDLESKVSSLIEYLEDPKNRAILFVDEVHMLFSGETYKKVAQMLKPALGRGSFMMIAATTTQEVKKIDEDPAFNRRFTRVLVDELTKEQTIDIVEHTIPELQKHYGVKIANDERMAELIVNIADEFCSVGSHRPDNALTLLDRTIANHVVAGRKNTVALSRERIEETAYRMTSGNSCMRRLDEESLREKLSGIRGQEEIIEKIINVIRLHDMHVRPRTKPLTFLFAGPSGVGKSEIARIISNEYMGEKPIVLNMAEYNSPASMNRIVGAPAGYAGFDSNSELPFDKLDTNPYQLILLDEFEKCDRSVQRLFMSVFDEGVMKTNIGKEIDFSKAIVIATTNAGCTECARPFGFGKQEIGSDLTVSELAEYFDVELLNRFSHKYTFAVIGRDTYKEIVRDTYRRVVSELDRERTGPVFGRIIEAGEDEKTIEMLTEKSYQPMLGARPALTIVTEYIDHLLLDTAKKGRNKTTAFSYAYEKAV